MKEEVHDMINDDSVDKLAQAIKSRAEQSQEQREMTDKVRNLDQQPYYGNGYYVIGTIKNGKKRED